MHPLEAMGLLLVEGQDHKLMKTETIDGELGPPPMERAEACIAMAMVASGDRLDHAKDIDQLWRAITVGCRMFKRGEVTPARIREAHASLVTDLLCWGGEVDRQTGSN